MTSQIINANEIVGLPVKNNQNESVGTINSVMLDKVTGQVAYVVLSYSNQLELDNTLFALPWHIFSFNDPENCFTVPFNTDKIRNAPGFDIKHWPDMSNPSWRSSINSYYDH